MRRYWTIALAVLALLAFGCGSDNRSHSNEPIGTTHDTPDVVANGSKSGIVLLNDFDAESPLTKNPTLRCNNYAESSPIDCSIFLKSVDSGLIVKIRFVNGTNSTITIARYGTTAPGIMSDANPRVFRLDGSLLYPRVIGTDIELPMELIDLTPDQSIVAEVNLSEMYDISNVGRYFVKLQWGTNYWLDDGTPKPASHYQVCSNIVAFEVASL